MKESIWHEDKFNPNAQFAVRKPFTFGSEDFVKGEIFDKKTSPRQLRILYENRFLVMVPPAKVAPVVVESPPPVPDLEEQGEEEEESGSVSSAVADPDVSDAPEPPQLVTKPGGWYDVVNAEGVVLNQTSLRIEDANRLIEETVHDLDVRRGPGEQ